MPINWKEPGAFQRLLAAVYAASPQNHNFHEIATMFGQGATYDAIEGRFRIIKREAQKLKAEVESGERPAAPARGTGVTRKRGGAAGGGGRGGSRNSSQRSSQGVLTGRVTKGGRKAKAGGAVKQEAPSTSEGSLKADDEEDGDLLGWDSGAYLSFDHHQDAFAAQVSTDEYAEDSGY